MWSCAFSVCNHSFGLFFAAVTGLKHIHIDMSKISEKVDKNVDSNYY